MATKGHRSDGISLVPHLGLGFANTLRNRLTGHAVEGLNSYGDLVAWAREKGALSEPEAEQILREALHRPLEAASALARSVSLREAIYRVLSAVAGGRPAEAADVMALNRTLASALAVLHIVATEQGFAWAWRRAGDGLDRVLWPVILSTVTLLTSDELRAVRECAAPNCGWLFLDTTRNRSRRWCDMTICGNRAKARRHYERKKQAAGRQGPEDRSQPHA